VKRLQQICEHVVWWLRVESALHTARRLVILRFALCHRKRFLAKYVQRVRLQKVIERVNMITG